MKRHLKLAAALILAAAMCIPALTCFTSAAAEPMPANTVFVNPSAPAAGTDVEFTFLGKTYSGKVGTTVFATLKEGLAALTPGGTMWLAPATYTEGVTIDKDVTVLGPKAGINPNVRGEKSSDDWTRSPERGSGEAVLTTSWHMGINAPSNAVYDCHEITVDGISVSGAGMFRSNYGAEGHIKLNYKNILVYGYTTANNGPFYCYSYYPDRATDKYVRDVSFENIRFEGQTTAPGFTLTADKVDMKGIYFDANSTAKAFTYLTMSTSAASSAAVTYTVSDSMFRQRASQILTLDVSTSAGGHGFNNTCAGKASITAAVKNCVFYDNDPNLTESNMIVCKSNTDNVSFVLENNSFVKASNETPSVPDAHTFDLSSELKWFGRTYNDGFRYFFNWSASGFSFNFKGTGAKATIVSNAPGGVDAAYIKIYVDGVWKKDVLLDAAKKEVVLASGLDAGKEHSIMVVKRTNARSSTSAVTEVKVDDGEKLAPDAEKSRLIEFIGDSLTVGYGSVAGNASAWSTATEDVMKTYAPAIADAFDADFNVVAISGRGVVKNYGGDTDKLIGEIYPETDIYNLPGTKWGFERKPDVIIINMGTNDASAGVSTADMRAGAKAFLKEVRELNPNSEIIWTYCLTNSGEHTAIKSAVEQFAAEGDAHVSYFRLTPCTEAEKALGHPLAVAYEKRAQSLIDVIAEKTGWKSGEEPSDDTTAEQTTAAPEISTSEPLVSTTDTPAPGKKGCGSSMGALAAVSTVVCAGAATASVRRKKETPGE
ncbi:MAG: GDSL-type esterase/lipase family protein [Clostridia bacterium]|nr:GDSL-type esterase/lipase family protein [Clostridia bacterium]